ncbi:MAG TPA: CotH kinase family protein [Methylomirabilota bacterium]|nr:CotH kinase family protein [Methylomirabilota bacterium]
MDVGRHLFALLAATLAAVFTFPARAATYPLRQKPAPGAEIFDNKHVLGFRIEISPSELATLRRNDRQPVRATVHEGTNVWRDVGLHVKGAAGSRRGIDDINDGPALTLSFGKFTPDQRFYGLRKIHLNNSVQDGSFMTENICSELFRKAGVPTPRVSYATLVLNGKNRGRGLYVLKEGFTKDMLGLYFKNTEGNLYDGEFLREITEPLKRDQGEDEDVNDRSDLKALAKAAQEPDTGRRWAELNRVLDMDRFLSFCALEVMTWDWDGYVMKPNNYRVYHDLDTGRMVFFPHGMDQMFWETSQFIVPRPNVFNGLVARAMMETPQGRKLYRERFGQLFTNVFQIEVLTNRVHELAELIRPHLRSASQLQAFNNNARVVHDRLVAQHANWQKRLGEPEPKPLVFSGGFASITNWTIPLLPRDPANAIRDRVRIDGRSALRILTTNRMTNTSASWRASALLGEGTYRLEALAKVAGVVSLMNTNKGGGAGIRHSGIRKPRTNHLEGESDWEKLHYEFELKYEEEVQLLCELRATQGEVWFDANSFRLVKVK